MSGPSISNPPPVTLPLKSSEVQPQIDVTILRAQGLPHLKTSLSWNRDFYVTVTNGVKIKKTATRKSVAQAVQWNQNLGTFGVHSSSRIEVCLYAKKITGPDILVGKQRISSAPQNDALLVLENVDKTAGDPGQQLTLYLSIAVSIVSGSSLGAIVSASGAEINKRHISSATGSPDPPAPLEDFLSQVDNPPVQQSSPVPQEADADAKTSVNALNNTYLAIKVIPVIDTWKSTVDIMARVMDALSPFAELHPCAKMAWGLLSKIPRAYLQQVERDENIQNLLKAMHDGFDFAQEAEALRDIEPKQAQILKLMLQHVCNGCDFIQTYAKDDKFRTRFLKNIGGSVDTTIKDYCATLKQLRDNFLDHAAITTEINTFQILDDVGILSVSVRGISTRLERVSKTVDDIDLDAKINGIPYKPVQYLGVERDYLPGTRMKFLDHIVDWVDTPDAERGLVLFGQAGTGKSSIAHEIARRFREMNRLTSHFVFLRTEQSKHNDYLLFTTLIRDLSDRYPSFKTALGAAIGKNQVLREAHDYRTLFEELLLQPLRNVQIVGPILVVIDALDESGDASGEYGLHTFLAKSIPRLPSEFRILITSRREKDISIAFDETSSVRIVEMTDPGLASTTGEDIRAYLQKRLPQNVFDKHGHNLESKAEGLFQWAAVACRFIRRPPAGFTINECITSLLHPSSDDGELEVLDRLYKEILEGYFQSPKVRPRFRSVMGQLLAAFEPFSITSLTLLRQHASNSPRDDEDSVIAIVSYLGSLLSNVASSDSSLPISHLHTSFRDFLTDKKSGEFCVDLKQAHYDLANYCLGLMLSELKFNICELESSYIANKDVPNLKDRIDQHISKALSYSCRFWDDHLKHLDFNRVLFNRLQNFFEKDFLFWLEVLSLTGDIAVASSALLVLKTWLVSGQSEPSTAVVEQFKVFIKDASTFVRYFGMPMAMSAPHIYVSCLPFAPLSSHVFKHYTTQFSHTLSLKRGQLSYWPALEMVIPAHDGEVWSVSFSPDGRYVVSGSSDQTIRIWNARTGEMVGEPFTRPGRAIYSVSFSPDGQRVVSSASDCTICMWNANTREIVGEPFTGHNDWIQSVSFSPDGQHIVSGSCDRTIRLWNASTGQMVGEPFIGHNDTISSVSFSPDGQHLVSGSSDCTVRIWNTSAGKMAREPLMGHSGAVSSVSFSPDGQHVISGSEDGTIRMWAASTGEMVGRPFTRDNNPISSVSFSPNGKYVVSGFNNSTICLWDTSTGEMVGELFPGHYYSVLSVSFSPDGQHIVSGSLDRTIRMWNASTEEITGQPFTGYRYSVSAVLFSPDGQYVVSGSSDNTVCIWNAHTGKMVGQPFTGHNDTVSSLSFSPKGQHIVSGSEDGTIRIWNASTGELVGEPFTGHSNAVLSVSFSPDGQHFVSGSSDCTIQMWNVGTGKIVGEPFTGHADWVESVSFSPDGQYIVSGSDDSTVRMWNASTRKMVREPLTGHTKWVRCVSFSPDGQYVASGSSDATICMWNASTGEMVGQPFTGHTDWVRSVSFSPDGQYIVSCSSDRTVRMWNARTGKMVGQPLTGHNDWVQSVSFSPDGKNIVSSSHDGTIWMRSVSMGEKVGESLTGHNGALKPEVTMDDNVHFTDHSIINNDGWIYGPKGELFLWIPQLHRSSLHRPSTVWVTGPYETLLDFSKFAHGKNWIQCSGRG